MSHPSQSPRGALGPMYVPGPAAKLLKDVFPKTLAFAAESLAISQNLNYTLAGQKVQQADAARQAFVELNEVITSRRATLRRLTKEREALVASLDKRSEPLSDREHREAVALAQVFRADPGLTGQTSELLAKGDDRAARRVRLLAGVDPALHGIPDSLMSNWLNITAPVVPQEKEDEIRSAESTAQRELTTALAEVQAIVRVCDLDRLREIKVLPQAVTKLPDAEKARFISKFGLEAYKERVNAEMDFRPLDGTNGLQGPGFDAVADPVEAEAA